MRWRVDPCRGSVSSVRGGSVEVAVPGSAEADPAEWPISSVRSTCAGLCERLTEAAPGLANVIAVATEGAALRIVVGTGDGPAAARVLRDAAAELRFTEDALIAIGSRSWVLRFCADGAMVGCAVLIADHDRVLPTGDVLRLERFGEEAAVEVASAVERDRAALAERWRVALIALPGLIHGATSKDEMLATAGSEIERVLPSSCWAVALRGVGREPFRLDASGPGAIVDSKPFLAAARRAVESDRIDIAIRGGGGQVLSEDATVMLAARLHDQQMRSIGAVAVQVPADGLVEYEHDSALLAALCGTLSLGLDLIQQTRAARILQRHDATSGLLTPGLLRDETTALSDACTGGNGTAAMILVQAAVEADPSEESPTIPDLLRRFATQEDGTELRIARLRAWRYAILAPDRSRRDAVMLAARLRWHLRTQGASAIGSSAGIAMIPDSGSSYEAILAAATGALDEAVSMGGGERIAAPRPRDGHAGRDRADTRQNTTMLQWLADLIDEQHFAGTSHSAAVAARARETALRLGVAPDLVDHVTLAGRFHDVGRALLSPHLFATAAPTDTERRLVQTHVVLGARLVATAGLTGAAECIMHMHERWDGTGEPQQLAGADIPLGARILAAANAFETVLNGHGRGDRGLRAAITAISNARSEALDPDVAAALLGTIHPRRFPETP
jgi:HD-GYP domain-containing protein (c-di-GMP phosphodiesterase class II)